MSHLYVTMSQQTALASTIERSCEGDYRKGGRKQNVKNEENMERNCGH